jgi:glycine cleavage system H protein
VLEFNDALNDTPDLINTDPYAHWIFKFKPDNPADINGLLDAAGYEAVAQDA